ncbi:MAG: hypothetical protein PHH14_06820 [Candidatus Margulisbacteria bacterium]|nr:hypothetical protein [Candidatus Margulisiibacteriota bacterium]
MGGFRTVAFGGEPIKQNSTTFVRVGTDGRRRLVLRDTGGTQSCEDVRSLSEHRFTHVPKNIFHKSSVIVAGSEEVKKILAEEENWHLGLKWVGVRLNQAKIISRPDAWGFRMFKLNQAGGLPNFDLPIGRSDMRGQMSHRSDLSGPFFALIPVFVRRPSGTTGEVKTYFESLPEIGLPRMKTFFQEGLGVTGKRTPDKSCSTKQDPNLLSELLTSTIFDGFTILRRIGPHHSFPPPVKKK